MKAYLTIFLVMLTLSIIFMSCTTNDSLNEVEYPGASDSSDDDDNTDSSDNNENGNNENNPMANKLNIHIDTATFIVTLENNATVTAFKALLPITMNMSEMNNNEKYYNLSTSLPTTSTRPGTIRTGDLMLYGSDCVVLFYKTFPSSYSYTRLGYIDNPTGLAATLGSGNVIVKID